MYNKSTIQKKLSFFLFYVEYYKTFRIVITIQIKLSCRLVIYFRLLPLVNQSWWSISDTTNIIQT